MTPDFLNYIRTLSKQDRKTLSQKALKTAEEVGELAKAVLPFDNAYTTTHRFVEKDKILEEVIDTCLTAISIAYALDFTDEDVDSMFQHKAEKWALLQSKEQDVKYPLPYECHITVTLDPDQGLTADLFKETCIKLGVKAIIIDLQDKQGAVKMVDVMTSSKHFGDNRSAYTYAHDIAKKLEYAGFDITRIKLETVPWHPAAPVDDQPMPKDCYFEAHIPVTTMPDQLAKLTAVARDLKLHPSRNVFKRYEDGSVVLMLTLRSYVGNFAEFTEELDASATYLKSRDWNVGKLITEFSIYDTKVSHDNSWINAK